MKRRLMLSAALTSALALLTPGRATAQYGGQYSMPGPGAGYYGSTYAGPGYQGPTSTGAGYIGPGAGPFQASPRPVFSPYLNLLGNNPASLYGTRLVPQLAAQQQSTRFIMPEPGTLVQPAPDVNALIPQNPPTGHGSMFMSYGSYYSQLNRGPRSILLTPYSTVAPRRR
jgi:hypothetical protein